MPEQNREAFRHGADDVERYFRNTRYGLGLKSRTILNLFNFDATPLDHRSRIDAFLNRANNLDDIFVYITGHGIARKESLYVMICSSVQLDTANLPDIELFVNVETLLYRIKNAASGSRVYAFIDTCSSGVLHNEDEILNPAEIKYLSNMQLMHMPRSGLVFLTSNNKNTIGDIIADDTLSEIKAPIFTHLMLSILRDGAPERYSFGLTITALTELIRSKIEELLNGIGRSDPHKTNWPQFTDEPDFERRSTALLSDIAIFPNNHRKNSLVLQAAKRIRLAYELEEDLRVSLQEKENQIDKLNLQVEKLTQTTTATSDAYRKLEETTVTLKEIVKVHLSAKNTFRMIALIEGAVIGIILSVLLSVVLLHVRGIMR